MLEVEPEGPVTEDQIADVEAKLGVDRFPDAYRRWLARTGGGTLSGDTTVPGTDGNGLLSWINGPDKLPLLQQLERNDVVPADAVVISGGHGGALALRVRGEDEGSVWWVDYDLADELDIYEASEQVMRRLADDFDGFLALFP